ncbi:hypothetical protein [Lentimicrobium sp. S6]|uniref:hypothetical protein n=1 Tax=Lentimicrobium sp. S6 TaxID=2735872 RepID=UPI0015578C86|nr:hypothetical protein [Lentimicrobium sp. S6]NPD45716.1 hypothetical protein [Lentimicrobium sp. S6]
MSTFYIQINSIKYYEKKSYNYLEAQLLVFSKDFQTYKDIFVNINSYHYGCGAVCIQSINDIINSINIYIDYDNSLELLDEKLFENRFQLPKLDKAKLLNDIDNLEFKYYSNSSYRFKKDNIFWKEIEISNLPNNSYITNLYMLTLRKSIILDSSHLSNNILLLTYDREDIYSRHCGKQEIEEDLRKSDEIRGILKHGVYNSIDLIKEKNERMKKKVELTIESE